MKKFPLNPLPKEFEVFKKLNTPAKIQDFLNKIPINLEPDGDTCRSPLSVLKINKAHCIEGAMLAGAILWYHGKKPLLLDLKTTDDDQDHVVALFKQNGHWGAISKTNHAVLRYRDPIFKTIRELVLSYFNEYFLDSGKKTLRSYSEPFDLLKYSAKYGDDWLTNTKNLWKLSEKLDWSRHIKILPPRTTLRPADPIEIQAGKILECKK